MSVATVIALSPAYTFDATVQSNSISNPYTAGMRIYLDPETGDVTSTPPANTVLQLDPDMENLLRHDSEGLTQTTRPDGTVFLDTAGRYGDVVVLRVDENGKMTFCQNNEEAIIKGMNDTTTPTGPEVK